MLDQVEVLGREAFQHNPLVHNYLNHHKYEPIIIHKIAQKFGKRGLELANLIRVLAGNKYRMVGAHENNRELL